MEQKHDDLDLEGETPKCNLPCSLSCCTDLMQTKRGNLSMLVALPRTASSMQSCQRWRRW